MSIPANAARLIAVAEAGGWVVHAHDGIGDGHESYGVRLRKGRVRAFGVWRDGKYLNGLVQGERPSAQRIVMGDWAPRVVGYRELLCLVQSDERGAPPVSTPE